MTPCCTSAGLEQASNGASSCPSSWAGAGWKLARASIGGARAPEAVCAASTHCTARRGCLTWRGWDRLGACYLWGCSEGDGIEREKGGPRRRVCVVCTTHTEPAFTGEEQLLCCDGCWRQVEKIPLEAICSFWRTHCGFLPQASAVPAWRLPLAMGICWGKESACQCRRLKR